MDKIKITTGDGTQEGATARARKEYEFSSQITPDKVPEGLAFCALYAGKFPYYKTYKYIITVYIIPSKILET